MYVLLCTTHINLYNFLFLSLCLHWSACNVLFAMRIFAPVLHFFTALPHFYIIIVVVALFNFPFVENFVLSAGKYMYAPAHSLTLHAIAYASRISRSPKD